MNWKIKKFFCNLVALPGFTRTQRRRIRDRLMFRDVILETNVNFFTTPSKPIYNKTKINVAFCSDKRGIKLMAVAIKSLLNVSANKCDYNIYCVIDTDVTSAEKKSISKLTDGTKSTITFLKPNHDFDKSYVRHWTRAIYYRTMLPDLLPDVDKIIYADIDVIFCNDLIEAYNIDMDKNYIAGVKTFNNGYINSGFLIMNLKQIRKDNLYKKWIDASQRKQYPNPDQDLLNFTCRGRILYLPLKYNFQPMDGANIYKYHTPCEIADIQYHLVVLHFSNWMKPWHAKNKRPIFSELWWKHATQTGLW